MKVVLLCGGKGTRIRDVDVATETAVGPDGYVYVQQGQNWSGAVNYLQQRANYIRSTMPLTTPP